MGNFLLLASELGTTWPDAVLMTAFLGFLGFVVWRVTR